MTKYLWMSSAAVVISALRVKEWTGMDFASSTRAAENNKKWKKIVVICGTPMTLQGYGIGQK